MNGGALRVHLEMLLFASDLSHCLYLFLLLGDFSPQRIINTSLIDT